MLNVHRKIESLRKEYEMHGTVKKAPGYELFFAPLQVVLDPTDYERVQFAYFCSKYGHAAQLRDDGSRYFDHPKAAAWIYIFELGGRDPRMVIDLLLHDMPEDTYLLSFHRISHNFGSKIALDVRAVTKLPKGKETTEQYLRRVIVQGPWAMLAKLCDRLHNLRDLHLCTREKISAQIEETHRYHLPLLIPALRTFGNPWSGYAKILEREIKELLRSLP